VKRAGLLGAPITLLLLLALWQAYVSVSGVSPLILPAPNAVLHALVKIVQRAATWQAAWVTLSETVGGFLIASLLGVGLGVVLGRVAWLERALQPVLVGFQVVPKIALVPLFIVWFGFGIGSKLVIAAVLAFLPVLSNTVLGVKSIEPGHRDVMISLRAGRLPRLWLLDLPSALPAVLTGMEVGIVLANIGAVVGEFLAGTEGLGHMAVAALNGFAVDELFAVILLLAAIGAWLYLAIVLLRRLLIPWHASAQTAL
jgi:NitT/TauT family transport system permease protein